MIALVFTPPPRPEAEPPEEQPEYTGFWLALVWSVLWFLGCLLLVGVFSLGGYVMRIFQ